MPRTCAVRGCDNKPKTWSNIIFHSFPTRNLERMKQWLGALNMDPNTPRGALQKMLVCSEHFPRDDYYEKLEPRTQTMKLFLKDTAIPSLGLTQTANEVNETKPLITSRRTSLLRIMTDFAREGEDDFFGTNEDPQPYQFEPEYTEEELQVLEAERAGREAEAVEQAAAERRVRAGMDWWCRCGACQPMPTENECFCCTEWELVLPSMGGLDISGEEVRTQRDCVTTNDAFPALVNPAVVETFFHLPKINWKKRPRPSGPNRQLSVDQYRLVSYRIVLEWALKGETLGEGKSKPLPSCVVRAIRRRYPSSTGTYQGFQEAQDAIDML